MDIRTCKLQIISEAMKKVKISFLLGLALAFFAVNEQQAQTIHDEMVFEVKCEDGLWVWCLEEPVEGTAIYNVVIKLNKEGEVKKFHANIRGGKLVGCETGTVYKIQNSWNETYISNKNNDQQVIRVHDKTHMVAPKGVRYTVLFVTKYTVNANGEVIMDIESVDFCQ
jgi:hypothetical protein